MEVVLARVDAVRRRCVEDMPALRRAFTDAAETLQVTRPALSPSVPHCSIGLS